MSRILSKAQEFLNVDSFNFDGYDDGNSRKA